MKITLSDKKLSDIFQYEELYKIFKCFSILTDIDVSLHDIYGNEELAFRLNREHCICEMVKNNNYDDCRLNMQNAALKAAELGEPYIYNCGCVVKCSAPIIFEEQLIGSIACGPVLLWEADEIAIEDMKNFISLKSIQENRLKDIIKHLKQLECSTMTSAGEMLYLIVNYISKEESKTINQAKKISTQQKQIAELLIEKNENDISINDKRNKLKKYPAELEKELIAYVQTGDKTNARKILNDILGEIFFYTSGDLDIIKAKLYELTAILMRAAVDIGAPLDKMSYYINYYAKILADNTTYEELCYMTREVMESFMSIVYEYRTNKSANKHLIAAIDYIKKHYNNKLSLKIVAREIFLNSYYLSHLFREELKMSFTDYLNKIRMEECLILLKNSDFKVQDIAQAVGYSDANYFTKAFKKHYGVSPKQYK